MSELDVDPSERPDPLAIFPLPGALLLPGGQLPLNIFEPRYLNMVRDAMAGSRIIGMIQPLEMRPGDMTPPIYSVGCAGAISRFEETEDGRFLITLTGIARFRVLEELDCVTAYRQVRPDWQSFADEDYVLEDPQIDRDRLLSAMKKYLTAKGVKMDWEAVTRTGSGALVSFLAMACPFAPNEKQAIIEVEDLAGQAELVLTLMEMDLVAPDGPDRLN